MPVIERGGTNSDTELKFSTGASVFLFRSALLDFVFALTKIILSLMLLNLSSALQLLHSKKSSLFCSLFFITFCEMH